MQPINEAMEEIRAGIAARVSRPVVCDPSRVANAPCVLIDLPEFTYSSTLCGRYEAEFPILVLGQPGSYLELGPLAALLTEVVEALEFIGIPFTRAQPVEYTPLNETGAADACMAYRITAERYL